MHGNVLEGYVVSGRFSIAAKEYMSQNWSSTKSVSSQGMGLSQNSCTALLLAGSGLWIAESGSWVLGPLNSPELEVFEACSHGCHTNNVLSI